MGARGVVPRWGRSGGRPASPGRRGASAGRAPGARGRPARAAWRCACSWPGSPTPTLPQGLGRMRIGNGGRYGLLRVSDQGSVTVAREGTSGVLWSSIA
eukprot:8694125-Pyramimonas_sp.AAC.1